MKRKSVLLLYLLVSAILMFGQSWPESVYVMYSLPVNTEEAIPFMKFKNENDSVKFFPSEDFWGRFDGKKELVNCQTRSFEGVRIDKIKNSANDSTLMMELDNALLTLTDVYFICSIIKKNPAFTRDHFWLRFFVKDENDIVVVVTAAWRGAGYGIFAWDLKSQNYFSSDNIYYFRSLK